MTNDIIKDIVPLDWTQENSIIKVIGVGGGGCNAVNYMFGQNIQGCSFIVANTNAASLETYAVPTKIQLGLTGLGAGTRPEVGRNAALDSQDEIAQKVLDCGTKMLFITAGMGGGTGTGASPVIAKMARDRGILTVAVVTIPFQDEGDDAMKKAFEGIHELERNTDAILIINNDKLYRHYGDMLSFEALSKADEVLATAVRGIIEVISFPGYIDVDFQDVSNILKDSGMALMGSGEGSGPGRLEQAVRSTFESPLLSDYDLKSARNILLNITSGRNAKGLMMGELETLDEMIAQYIGNANHFKKGIVWDDDPAFGDKVRITAIVTGLKLDLSALDKKDLDNVVVIDKDYVWDTPSGYDEAPPEAAPVHVRIDFDSASTRRHDYHGEKKPDLCVQPGQKVADLEMVTAIRRKQPSGFHSSN